MIKNIRPVGVYLDDLHNGTPSDDVRSQAKAVIDSSTESTDIVSISNDVISAVVLKHRNINNTVDQTVNEIEHELNLLGLTYYDMSIEREVLKKMIVHGDADPVIDHLELFGELKGKSVESKLRASFLYGLLVEIIHAGVTSITIETVGELNSLLTDDIVNGDIIESVSTVRQIVQ